ncbi:MAG: hypothetical protein GXP31_02160 [Kiritimatiellaeota bacterium]|nr:hypothetical protein [Kiritimatiellota bacterium]
MDELAEKVLRTESPGREAVGLRIVAPAVVRPGEDFSVRLTLADAAGCPAIPCDRRVEIEGAFARPAKRRLGFNPRRLPVLEAHGFSISVEGLYRFRGWANIAGRERAVWSNPVSCRPEGPRIWRGDPHVHTVPSDCHADRCRSLNFCYAAARRVSAVVASRSDIAAVELVRNGRSIQAIRPGKWWARCEFVDAADLGTDSLPARASGRFVFYYVRVTCTSGARAWSSPVRLVL